MKRMNLANALDEGIMEEMKRDKNVILFGEDVHTGCGAVPHQVCMENGLFPEQVMPMPINEQLFSNMAVGMALGGMRPIAEFGFEDFLSLAFDGIANQAAKVKFWTHSHEANLPMPIVYLTTGGVGAGCGPNHSQKAEAWLANIPGIKIICPTTAADHKGLIKTAIRDNDPVVFLVNRSLEWVEDDIPEDEDYLIPFGQARVAREGKDLTVVTWQRPYIYVMELAEELAKEGIDIEVIDPRSMYPFDTETVVKSVKKTGRLLVSHEACYKFGPNAEIITEVVQQCWGDLKAPPARACTPMTCIPSLSTEMETIVTKDQIREEIYKVMGKK